MVRLADIQRRVLASLIIMLAMFIGGGSESFAKIVTVSGKAPSYAGIVLVMRAQRDAVSRMTYDLSSARVAADGTFTFEADIDEVTFATIDLSFYEAYIYLEPGAKYEVTLPRHKLRPDADRFNPFYQPKGINLALKSASSDLNQSIRKFDEAFAHLYYPNAVRIVRKHDKALADKVIAQLDSAQHAIGCRKAYFAQHANYRKAEVYATPRVLSPRTVLRKYFAGQPVAFNVPAYWNVINILSPDVIHENPNRAISKKLEALAAKGGAETATQIDAILATDTLLRGNQSLRELLILKNIRDDYYSHKISDGRADTLLATVARDFKNKHVRLMAANIYAMKNKLKPGLPAPEFNLVDNKDNDVNLETFRGKFLYLCFMHSENYECMKALPVLDNIANVHRNDLSVLCVFTDDESDALYAKLAKQTHNWRAISWITSQRILSDYEVRGLPTYYLIDPDGCISIAQAPGPSENVGPAIAESIRQYKIVTLRGRKEVPRTIYDLAK